MDRREPIGSDEWAKNQWNEPMGGQIPPKMIGFHESMASVTTPLRINFTTVWSAGKQARASESESDVRQFRHPAAAIRAGVSHCL